MRSVCMRVEGLCVLGVGGEGTEGDGRGYDGVACVI